MALCLRQLACATPLAADKRGHVEHSGAWGALLGKFSWRLGCTALKVQLASGAHCRPGRAKGRPSAAGAAASARVRECSCTHMSGQVNSVSLCCTGALHPRVPVFLLELRTLRQAMLGTALFCSTLCIL
eukprot:356613-Chlamydomonas_euryale.AAC.3